MKIAALLLALVSLSASADWSPGALTKLRDINEKYKGIGEGEMLTAWGGWKRYRLMSPKLKGKVMSFPTKETSSGEVRAYLYEHPVQKPVPLIVYFPGIFGQVGDKITEDTIAKFEAFESHVLVIPNFLSEGWLRAGPIYDRHPAMTEIMLINTIWKEVHKKIPYSRMSGLHVVGESLGTILASAFSAQADLGEAFPNTLTLLWPPAKLDVAMKNLDDYLARAEKNACSDFLTFPLFVGFFMLTETPMALPAGQDKCLASWGARKGFMKGLDKVTSLLVQQTKAKPFRSKNFQNFFEIMHKPFWKLLSENDETMDLTYWLGLIREKKPSVDLRILTSFDDFLNKGMPLTEVARKAGYPLKKVYVFDWGGHAAPMATKEFAEVLRSEFEVPKEL